MKVELTGDYDRMYRSLVVKDGAIKKIVVERIKLFKKNPSDSRLDNHPLRKRLTEKWAFSVTDDIRIIYRWIGKSTVRFLAIGTHVQLYQKH